MNSRYRFFDDETVQAKTKQYTKPHPIVASHLLNLQSRGNHASIGPRFNNGGGLLPNFFVQAQVINAANNMFPIPQVRIQHPARQSLSPQTKLPSHQIRTPHSHERHNQQSNNPERKNDFINKKRHHASAVNSTREVILKKKKANENTKYDEFTNELLNFTSQHQQSDNLLQSKLHLRDALLAIFRREFPECSLHLVGSSCNGFATNNSDADFCLMLSHNRNIDRSEALLCLSSLQRLLRKYGFFRKIQFIRAKVPILKFIDSVSSCECDININNSIGIRNTHLLRSYSKIDKRVSPLVAVIKYWAKSRKINDASQGTLSSYSLVLMVIHYLQSVCQPPILMSLQEDYPKYFDYSKNVDELPMFEPTDHIDCNSSENDSSLGELVEGFFSYFANEFDFNFLAVSVRLGRAIPKSLNSEFVSKYICVEEPFERTNTARAVYEYSRYQLIKQEFIRADRQLKQKLSLNHLVI